MKYDYLIVGAGLFGSICAYELSKKRKSVLVIDKRPHIGGNIYTTRQDGIFIHRYGAHIFHTSNKEIWDYMNSITSFDPYINCPIANYKGEIYNLPFNMNTFNKMWGVVTPDEALAKIEEEKKEITKEPENLEEQAISLVGKTIYQKLIKGYTEKQWGKDCKDLPKEIIKRLPVRLSYDNNYFRDKFQGIPRQGYTKLIENLLEGIDVRLNTPYSKDLKDIAKTTIYTGPIDEYYNYCLGELEYRGLKFETERLDTSNYQGNAVVNYTERETPYTRIIEHKFFIDERNKVRSAGYTYITKEYPNKDVKEPYYPINDEKNNKLYGEYEKLSKNDKSVIFGGRLGTYQYLDMDKIVEQALKLCKNLK